MMNWWQLEKRFDIMAKLKAAEADLSAFFIKGFCHVTTPVFQNHVYPRWVFRSSAAANGWGSGNGQV